MSKFWQNDVREEKLQFRLPRLLLRLSSGKFFRNSVGIQLFLVTTSVAFLSLGILGYLFYLQIKSERISLIQNSVKTEAKRLDTSLELGENFLESLVATTQSLHRSGIRSPQVYKSIVLSLMGMAKPDLITGYGIMQTPYGLVPEKWFGPYVEESIGRGEILKINPRFSYVELWQEEHYENLNYYKDTLQSHTFFWSEPYINPSYPIPLITYAGPIQDETGKIIAVMNGDISLNDLQELASKGIPGEPSYYIATTEKGTLLAYPPDENKAKSLINIATITDLKPVWNEIRRRLDQGKTADFFQSSQTQHFWFYAQIPSSKWMLITRITYASAIQKATINAIGATLLAMALFAIAIWLFVSRLNHRLQPIMDVCYHTIELNEEVNDGDEIDRLSSAFFRLINQQNDLSQKLQETNNFLTAATTLKDQFLASMSHELRTPLNAVLGMSEALLENLLGPLNQRQEKAIKTVYDSGQRLLTLIEEILDLSKIEAGALELVFSTIRVQLLCQSSLLVVRDLANKKNINLQFQIPDSLKNKEIWVDHFRIRQALVHLLSNGIKFTPPGGEVQLIAEFKPPGTPIPNSLQSLSVHNSAPSTHLDLGVMILRVTDTGIGIAPEDFEKLFQAFVQIDSTLSRQYEGTGLGLTLVQRIVKLHDGTVTVESELGKGSCFSIWLPLRRPPEPGVG